MSHIWVIEVMTPKGWEPTTYTFDVRRHARIRVSKIKEKDPNCRLRAVPYYRSDEWPHCRQYSGDPVLRDIKEDFMNRHGVFPEEMKP